MNKKNQQILKKHLEKKIVLLKKIIKAMEDYCIEVKEFNKIIKEEDENWGI